MKILKKVLLIALCYASAIASPVVKQEKNLISNDDSRFTLTHLTLMQLTRKGYATETIKGKLYSYKTEEHQDYSCPAWQPLSKPEPEATKKESRKDRVARLVVSQTRNPFKLMMQSKKKTDELDQEVYG